MSKEYSSPREDESSQDLRDLLRTSIAKFNQYRRENPDVPIDLSGSSFSGLSLMNSNFKGVNLVRSDLSRTDLYGTDFTQADLTGSNLSEAQLFHTDLTDANLTDTKLNGAKLYFVKGMKRTDFERWLKSIRESMDLAD